MASLWVPPSVSRELQHETLQHRAEVLAAARRDATCDYWDKELQKIDSKLTLVKAHEDAQVPGLRPGFWHVVRDCSPGPPSILPVVGDDGEFVEPTSRLLDMLRAGDLQNPRAMADRRRRDEAKAKAAERQKQNDHEDRVSEMMDRWRAVNKTTVLVSDDVAWTQSANGRRGKRAA